MRDRVDDAQHDLMKDQSESSKAIQAALAETQKAAEEGRYDDAEKSLMAAQKEALAMAKANSELSKNEDTLAKEAVEHLKKAHDRAGQEDRQKIKGSLQRGGI